MAETPTDDRPGFVAEKPERCIAENDAIHVSGDLALWPRVGGL